MKIQTLAEILAEQGIDNTKKEAKSKPTHKKMASNKKSITDHKKSNDFQKKAKKHPKKPKISQKMVEIPQKSGQKIVKNDQKDTPSIDNLTDTLTLKTAEQHQADIDDIKAKKRLRWLAFYYLSTREHSAQELKQKLLNKEQDPDQIDALLIEFDEKGYQSEERTAFMLIREGIRKGRGRNRIKQDFLKRKIALPNNIDELIDMANDQSAEFIDFIDGNESQQVDWLKLAIEARVKKYGDDIPSDMKEKAKQLRFLQYRGFQNDICFDALKHNIDSYYSAL